MGTLNLIDTSDSTETDSATSFNPDASNILERTQNTLFNPAKAVEESVEQGSIEVTDAEAKVYEDAVMPEIDTSETLGETLSIEWDNIQSNIENFDAPGTEGYEGTDNGLVKQGIDGTKETVDKTVENVEKTYNGLTPDLGQVSIAIGAALVLLVLSVIAGVYSRISG